MHAQRDSLVEGDSVEGAYPLALTDRVGPSVAVMARDQDHEGRQEQDDRSDQEQEHQAWVWAQLTEGFSPPL